MVHVKRLLVVVLALAFSGCGDREPPPARTGQPALQPGIQIGLIPEHNVFRQLDRYEPLASYLSRKTGEKIALRILPRYGNIVDNFVEAKLDGAFFGSFSYALAHRKIDVQVVARPVGLDGRSTYHGLVFARLDSGIRAARDLKGKRFVFVDKATTAGYLLLLDWFRRSGIADYRQHLKETYFAGTHEDAIYDVLDGKADAGAAKNTVFERLAREDQRLANELAILDRSPDVPENALAVRPELDPGTRTRIGDALLSMHDDPEGARILAAFGARQFIRTTDEDYAPVYEYARAIGIDLARYDSRNDR
jgi:phosphonate transport system substrate-binding protein